MLTQKPYLGRKAAFAAAAFLIIPGAAAIFIYLEYDNSRVSTDDAFVDGHLHQAL